MKIYKWENLKNQAACMVSTFDRNMTDKSASIYGLLQSVEQQMTKEKIKNWRENSKEMILKAQKIVDNWDVRCANKLFELFPSIIPKKYKNRSFSCDYNEKCEWVIIFD